MLSKSTISAQQKISNDLLVGIGTIYSPSVIDDGYGVKTPNFVIEAIGVPIRVQAATRVPKAGTDQYAMSVLTDWRLVVPIGTLVQIGWRIDVANRSFDVEDVDDTNVDVSTIVLFCFQIAR